MKHPEACNALKAARFSATVRVMACLLVKEERRLPVSDVIVHHRDLESEWGEADCTHACGDGISSCGIAGERAT
jgi:hypothetical protein